MAKRRNIDPDELFVELLTAKRFRLVRHLLLWLFVLCLGVGNMYMGPDESIVLSLGVTVIILVPVVLNVYVFVPGLLLRNRPQEYLAVVIISVVSALVLGNAVQYRLEIPVLVVGDDHGTTVRHLVLSNVSTLVSFSLIIAGTTAVIILQLWLRDRKRINSLERAAAAAELDMLQNQINPHFLFNMLNNAIVQLRETPAHGRETILRLKEMLDYQLSTSHAQVIALGDDINFLNDFLHLEQLRRDRFDYRIMMIGDTDRVHVPPLLFIPFVENAVKHGNDNTGRSYIVLVFSIDGDRLHFFCSNSVPARHTSEKGGGLGLKNTRRRLELIYGDRFTLNTGGTGMTYNVNLTIGL